MGLEHLATVPGTRPAFGRLGRRKRLPHPVEHPALEMGEMI
jgi:hypothetical protein